ncbi:MAG: ADP-ribosylglycohydrolase family protein [Lentisphaeria bacterium]|nr:ADP-ribosylglycohydrolase family protein [Lentisphaeria bacterium]
MKLDYATYYDKVLGCWTGKSIGGIIGAPYECHKHFKECDPDKLWPKILYPNDDLDIQVVYMEALQKHGLFIDSNTLAKYWKEHCFYTCCEYGIFIDNFDGGIMPPYSGTFNNDWYHEGMGCPIRAEIWGILCPGNPELAAEYAAIDGCLDHSKFSIEVEQFWSAACSMTFFESDLKKLLSGALNVLPKESRIHQIYQEVSEICEKSSSLKEKWTDIIRRWGHRNGTATETNFPLTLMALYLSNGDFKKAMHICIQSGWDADCTAATAGAMLGLIHGSSVLPADYCEKMGKTLVCACEIPHQFATLASFAEETCALGVEMSLCRNTQLEITNAPAVEVRKAPEPQVTLTAEYQDQPVLYCGKPTFVDIVIENPFDAELTGVLKIGSPEYTTLKFNPEVSISPKASQRISLEITGNESMEYMNTENRFFLEIAKENGKKITGEFGLRGAVQYQVYGPYWDMWDKDKYEVCPYDCDEQACNPANAGFSRDAMDMYVKLENEYLDESALLLHDLPQENPYSVQKAGFFLYSRDLGGFFGTGCHYLVIDFCGDQPVEKAYLWFGCNVPWKAWVDGKLMFEQKFHACCNQEFSEEMTFALTGKPQRMVVKLAARTEKIEIEWAFRQMNDVRTMAISPYIPGIRYKVLH